MVAMDEAGSGSGSASGSAAKGGRNISVHPLVIMNISDYHTTVRLAKSAENAALEENANDGSSAVAQSGSAQLQRTALGALFGTQKGRNVNVCDSCELAVVEDDSKTIDVAYLKVKVEQYQQVFSDYELLGWWVAKSGNLSEDEMVIHKQICEHNELPLLLQLDVPAEDAYVDAGELPIRVYESVLQANARIFINVDFVVDTSESERVAVDYIMAAAASASGESTAASALTSHAATIKSAVASLTARMKLLKSYLIDVKSGKTKRNHAMLRDAASLLHQLPLAAHGALAQVHGKRRDDAYLIAYLARLTTGLHAADEAVKCFMDPSSASEAAASSSSASSSHHPHAQVAAGGGRTGYGGRRTLTQRYNRK